MLVARCDEEEVEAPDSVVLLAIIGAIATVLAAGIPPLFEYWAKRKDSLSERERRLLVLEVREEINKGGNVAPEQDDE